MNIIFNQALKTTAITTVLFAGVPIDSHLDNIQIPTEPSTRIALLEGYDPYTIALLEGYDPYTIVTKPFFNSDEKLKIINHFARDLLENMEDSPIEFSQALEEHFWDLI